MERGIGKTAAPVVLNASGNRWPLAAGRRTWPGEIIRLTDSLLSEVAAECAAAAGRGGAAGQLVDEGKGARQRLDR
jgi:hypothetical protein